MVLASVPFPRPTRDYVPAYPLALVHASLGRMDRAFAWLEKARGEGAPELVYAAVDPWLDPLRGDPRFADLPRVLGFPESPRGS